MNESIYLKSGEVSIKVNLADILYAKAEGKYVRVVEKGRSHFIRCSISYLQETLLHQAIFCRIHKSYIISLDHLKSFDSRHVMVEDKELPIGRRYKKIFMAFIQSSGETQQAPVFPIKVLRTSYLSFIFLIPDMSFIPF